VNQTPEVAGTANQGGVKPSSPLLTVSGAEPARNALSAILQPQEHFLNPRSPQEADVRCTSPVRRARLRGAPRLSKAAASRHSKGPATQSLLHGSRRLHSGNKGAASLGPPRPSKAAAVRPQSKRSAPLTRRCPAPLSRKAVFLRTLRRPDFSRCPCANKPNLRLLAAGNGAGRGGAPDRGGAEAAASSRHTSGLSSREQGQVAANIEMRCTLILFSRLRVWAMS